MKRVLASVAVVFLLWLMRAPPIGAGEQWCEDDPLVVITTPGGSQVPIYATNAGLGLEHLAAVQSAQINYSVSSAQSSTVVKMTVTVPGDQFGSHFDTRTTASTGALATGTVFATASGFSGQAMRMQFKLNVP